MTILYADTETYSEIPINHGTHAYSEGGVKVMLFSYAIDDGPPLVVDRTLGEPFPKELFDPKVTVVFHNSHFDRTVLWWSDQILIPVERIHDTYVQALAHALPGGLGPLGEILGLPEDKAKDKAGKSLINLFCKPRPKNMLLRRATRGTHPAEWTQFKEYARLDIEAMREIYKRLPAWNYSGIELDLWRLDQKINDRGVYVDRALAEGALKSITREKKDLAHRANELTDGAVPSTTQRDVLLAHLLEAHGVSLPDMQASTLERRMNDPNLSPEVHELLAIRLQATTSSTSKYSKLLSAVSGDDRLRGLLQFDGASRTRRWAGRIFQPQNLPRPNLKQKVIDQGIEAFKADCVDLITDNVMELASNCIRGVIAAPKGRKLVVADLANIEGRVAAWLAGEDWKLDAFRAYDAGTGHDLYAIAYARAFGITPEEVMENKKSGNGMMRAVGKVMELMLQYEGGVGAYLTGAETYRVDLAEMAISAGPNIPQRIRSEANSLWGWATTKKTTFGLDQEVYVVCDSLKRLWREAHPNIVQLWADISNAARSAILNKGVSYPVRSLIFRCDGAWLRIKLPSGRYLCYPSPRVSESGEISYAGINQYSRKWDRIKSYGGKFFENICQSVARDIMADGMIGAEKEGYYVLLTVHDELITETKDSPYWGVKGLTTIMATVPSWAQGLPLAAAGFEGYRYRKD